MGPEIPSEIRRYGKIVRQLEKLNNPSHAEKELLNFARLKVAVWACQQEGIKPTRDNVRSVLGANAESALQSFSRLSPGEPSTGGTRVLRPAAATAPAAVSDKS